MGHDSEQPSSGSLALGGAGLVVALVVGVALSAVLDNYVIGMAAGAGAGLLTATAGLAVSRLRSRK